MRLTNKTMAIALALAAAITITHAAPTDNNNITLLENADKSVTNESFITSNSTSTTDMTPMTPAWAQFCDDEQCSENCGIAVSLGNPDCLYQVDRKSV